jgi:hypothetical protein
MTKGQHPEPPAGLSRQAAARWQEQADALFSAGRLTAARVELLGAWAASIDSAAGARAAWGEQGRPLEQPGRSGQPRPHHLKTSVERAEAQLAQLTAKVERSAARREQQRRADGLPIGATTAVIDGVEVVVGEDGRLIVPTADGGGWRLCRDERGHDAGERLRWTDPGDQLPRFAAPPPLVSRDGPQPPTLDECAEWARLRSIPVEAVFEWRDQERPMSPMLVKDGVDIARWGLKG